MWCKTIALILLLVFNLGESLSDDPITSKSVGDDLPISMPTHTQYIVNNSRLEVNCSVKFQPNGKPAEIKFLNGDDNVHLTSTNRMKITISNDLRKNRTIGQFVWDPIYVQDNRIKTVHCRDVNAKSSKVFRIVVIPSVSVPKVSIVNGSRVDLKRGVPFQLLICVVKCQKTSVVEGCNGKWSMDGVATKALPSGLTTTTKDVDATTSSTILNISDPEILDGKKLYCLSQIKSPGDSGFKTVRKFFNETLVSLRTESGDIKPALVKTYVEIVSKWGQDAVLDCKASGVGPPKLKWWIQNEYSKEGYLVKGDISLVNGRYSFRKIKGAKSAANSIIDIKDVTYDDRIQFVCQKEYLDQTINVTFTLRVADPLGTVWPIVGIVSEAILLVIIIWTSEFIAKKKRRDADAAEKQRRDLLTNSEGAPLMKSNGDGANEVPA